MQARAQARQGISLNFNVIEEVLMTDIKEALKEKMISQDEEKRAHDDVQKLTDKHVAEVDQVLAEKEKELMQV